MENLLGDQPVPGLVPHDLEDLEAQLHLACDDGEPRSYAEAERHAAWRAAMQTEMDAVNFHLLRVKPCICTRLTPEC